ncbi:hypothetical protein ASF29_12440 [Rhizobium sp. Leaf262]|nr:hypothetical protein ASF29_12440 [Rhizobium sp. Leaf262]
MAALTHQTAASPDLARMRIDGIWRVRVCNIAIASHEPVHQQAAGRITVRGMVLQSAHDRIRQGANHPALLSQMAQCQSDEQSRIIGKHLDTTEFGMTKDDAVGRTATKGRVERGQDRLAVHARGHIRMSVGRHDGSLARQQSVRRQ